MRENKLVSCKIVTFRRFLWTTRANGISCVVGDLNISSPG